MTPYYDDGTCTIYHGDCREVLTTVEPADLLLTDPPYGVDWKSGKGQHDKIIGDDGSLVLESWLDLALRKIRRGRHVYIFGLNSGAVPASMPLCGMTELIWDKGVIGMGDLAAPWGPAHESILFGVQEVSKSNRAKGYGVGAARLRKGSVLRIQRGQSGQTKRHPTEKPVDLLRVLIESSSTFGETVLDPFMGSGSSLVAAAAEGRKAVGIEIDERYCEVAALRLGTDPRSPVLSQPPLDTADADLLGRVADLRSRISQSDWIVCAEVRRLLDGSDAPRGSGRSGDDPTYKEWTP
jgi:hypothetical protein